MTPRFTAPAGVFVGRRDGGVLRATGIRYARAERFHPPRPEPREVEPVDATKWSPRCPQIEDDVVSGVLPVETRDLRDDESCQYLSVTMPGDLAPGERLPVMVWIHGGAYVFGSPDAAVCDPAQLVAEQRVVAVTVGYRLGLLGYLGGTAGRPANLGLLDQLQALHWVHDNIAGFGGDPDLVTVFGQSAGGDAVAHLMISEGARGLFRRAVVQSAPLGITRGREPMYSAMERVVSEVTSDDALTSVLERQGRATTRLVRHGLRAFMPYGTQYGHVPLPPETDLDDAWSRVAPEVDLMIGATTRETAFYALGIAPLTRLREVPVVGPSLTERGVRLTTDRVFARAAEQFSARHVAAGGRAYRYTIGFGRPDNPYRGAHCIDLPLLLGGEAWRGAGLLQDHPWDDVQRAGRLVRGVWAEFARTGRPPAVSEPGVIELRATEPSGA